VVIISLEATLKMEKKALHPKPLGATQFIKKEFENVFLLTFKVLVSAWVQGRCLCTLCKLLSSPPLCTFLKVPFASS